MDNDQDITEAAGTLAADHGLDTEAAGRVLRLLTPVKGDARLSALRAVGVAQHAAPVAAVALGTEASKGTEAVGAALWCPPLVYLVQWLPGHRWVAGYRLPPGTRPHDIVRSEGRIPSRYEVGHWYAVLPDEVMRAAVAVGLDLDHPPFVLPDPPPPPGPPRSRPAGRPRTAARAEHLPKAPRPKAAPRPAPPKAAEQETRICPGCHMRRVLTQFDDEGLCVDCR